ncbi:MAG TPA: pyruvate, phosphate dikinase [Actinomycetota bacterium]|nr:pyruvate, phosphate dikinase [Actinomycetota bacterium]
MAASRFVLDFHEGNKDMKDLLGGKGANLAEMTNLGLPVPPGFTITTEACLAYLDARAFPDGLMDEVETHLRSLESAMGKRLGDDTDPLLVSVRSGAKFSMPGMMDTVLNLGLNDRSVEGLAKQSNDERFAWDSYRRFVQMFGKIVLGIDADRFEERLDAAKEAKGEGSKDADLDADDLRTLTDAFKAIVGEETGEDFPQDPRQQLEKAIEAVFGSWNTARAVAYRRQNKISDSLGTAVNVVAMVFGNMGQDSGTGVVFTRNPATGEKEPYGDYLSNAQGEDVVAGIRNTLPVRELERLDADSYGRLLQGMTTLENHFRDMCDIEFTIERGTLWFLQTRVGKRTAFGEWVMGFDMVDEDLITLDEGLLRLDANRLEQLFKPVIQDEQKSSEEAATRGLNASPGAAVGRVVFTADAAASWAGRGEQVILVRRETTPDDYHGMIRSQGILTSAGGTNSHAAVVARGEGIPAVCGADGIRIQRGARVLTVGDVQVEEGDWITIDGSDGSVYLKRLDLVDPPLAKAVKGDPEARRERIWRAFELFMRRADEVRRLRVRANADTPEQSSNARDRGAEGIGLCRTEHMFLGEERVAAVRTMIFASSEEDEREALDALLPLQRKDFVGIFEAMDGLPVTVRLLDPPLHEFLPNHVDLAVAVAVAEERGEAEVAVRDEKLPLEEARETLRKVEEMAETNPMLGLRGVRLGIVKPGLYAMQVRAIVEAACDRVEAGGRPLVEIMIPLVATREELRQMREELEPVAASVLSDRGASLPEPVAFGTMIELPRSAVTAGEIAEVADFFSFGTNDLTQTAFGFSRDDIGKFLAMYEERKLVPANPFVTIDRPGVGRLMSIAVSEGRRANGSLHLGICGEHGGDPESVRFCHEVGLDYVSCSPFRVETARLAAGQASVGQSEQAAT